MNATVEVVCYKSKVLANNESPLMLRISKDRKLKYSSIGISVNPVYWDFEKNKPRRNCPDKTRIEQIIAEQIRFVFVCRILKKEDRRIWRSSFSSPRGRDYFSFAASEAIFS